MLSDIRMFTFLPILALLTMCAPVQPPPPQPTPLTEEITILRKQLLELQKLQNGTKAKLDETNDVIAALSARLKVVESKQSVMGKQQLDTRPSNAATVAQKKKTVKKKKKVRRQE